MVNKELYYRWVGEFFALMASKASSSGEDKLHLMPILNFRLDELSKPYEMF